MTSCLWQLAPFTPEYLPQAVRLSQQVSWPHRPQDWAMALAHSKGVVALENGRVVGTALVSLFGPVATLNMILVEAAMRGRGLGRQLMNAVIPGAADRELRLVATAQGLPLYQKMGFERAGHIQQFQGIVKGAEPEIPVSAGAGDLADLLRMDAAASGMARGDLLRAIASQGTVLRTEEGFAMIRRFGRGQVVGPIVAPDLPTARALLSGAAQQADGGFLRLDTGCPALGDLALLLGMDLAGGGTAMVRQARPRPQAKGRVFALVSQAFG
ncbi:GNAT family N-acetyltransferase [Thalassobius sp. S69A]|uniref:GNAT family N-acetyltransferase n=1 Tax=unclassified Thalassovita TaxID=2619711 RepID=UPI000C0CFB96|nr:GNAT family N-acetyltransferase [Paracoccaceae bacterium]MBT27017.1 GNAT family N-acetyltransferase [Paracoccaceae bacterium]